jgi:hypothetical protein
MKRIGKDRKVEEVKHEKYMKSEEVEEEKPRDQLEHEKKRQLWKTTKQFRLQDDEGLTLCTLLITMV